MLGVPLIGGRYTFWLPESRKELIEQAPMGFKPSTSLSKVNRSISWKRCCMVSRNKRGVRLISRDKRAENNSCVCVRFFLLIRCANYSFRVDSTRLDLLLLGIHNLIYTACSGSFLCERIVDGNRFSTIMYSTKLACMTFSLNKK